MQDVLPVVFTGAAATHVWRLESGIQLVATDGAKSAHTKDRPLCFLDHRLVPQSGILPAEGDVLALGIPSRAPSGFRVKHQAEQSQSLWLVWKQLGQKPSQEQCFFCKVTSDDIPSVRISPAFCKGSIDCVQYSLEPAAKLIALGNAQWDVSLADFVLSPYESFCHCRWRHEKCRGNCLGIQPEHCLYHERCAYADVDSRMSAGKHQGQTTVGDFRVSWHLTQDGGDLLQAFVY